MAGGAAVGFGKTLGLTSATGLGVLLLALAVSWLRADLPPTVHGHAIQFRAEVRLPPDFVRPATIAAWSWYAHLDTRLRPNTGVGELEFASARQEGGQLIVPVAFTLDTSFREKLVYVLLDKETLLFVLAFDAKSSVGAEWSPWQEGGRVAENYQAVPDQRFALRYRLAEVIPAPPAPPGPSPDDVLNAKTAAEEAALAALTPESPLEESMKFVHYTNTEERRYQAGAVIARRPRAVAELSEQILSPDAETADRALRAVPYIKPLPAGLVAPIGTVGDQVLAELARVVAVPAADDPRFQLAADLSVRFAGWFPAHHALHQAGLLNGIPQLEKMLALARQREDSHVLKQDVARIAQHYITEWTTPPPPRP
jgi:hypothetical protein